MTTSKEGDPHATTDGAPVAKRPPKNVVARQLLEKPSFDVYLDPRVKGVVVPDRYREDSKLILKIGHGLRPRIPDLVVDKKGFSATLRFGGTPFHCRVPWRSVFAMVCDDGRGMVWEDDVPVEVHQQKGTEAAEWDAWVADVDALAGFATPRGGSVVDYRTAEGEALRGRWVGCSFRPAASMTPMCMEVEIDLRGLASEYEVVGEGTDPLGRFSLIGKVDADARRTTFEKRYATIGGASTHTAVIDGLVMRGVWQLGADAGVFILSRASALDVKLVADLADRARRPQSPFDRILATMTAPFRAAARTKHARALETFRKHPAW